MTFMRTALAALACASCLVVPAAAADFYVQPVAPGPVAGPALVPIAVPGSTSTTASTSTTGKFVSVGTTSTTSTTTATATTPWKSIGAVLSSGQIKSGDRILLLDGYHGPIYVRGLRFASPIVIAPAPGATAHIDSILVDDSANIAFKSLKVWPRNSATATNAPIIRTYSNAADISFDSLDVRAAPDAPNYMTWSLAVWKANVRAAFMLQGVRNSVTNTRTTGVQYGVQSFGSDALIEANVIDGFSGDGIRAMGNNTIVRRNRVQNCFVIDGNHRDGFQSWSIGSGGRPGTGTLTGLVIENNEIFEWASKATNALRCQLQGIGMFDGMYDKTRIENNVVVVSMPNGIGIMGMTNSIIRNNTVVNPHGRADRWPWILLRNHKNGTPSRNVTLSSNFATRHATKANAINNIVMTKNPTAGAASMEFMDFANQNLALRPASRATDAGNSSSAAASDITGAKRWKGKSPDAGAYESN